MKEEQTMPPIHLDQEVDLLEYLSAILGAKYRILIAAVFAAGAVFGLSKLVDDKYTAEVLAAFNINETTVKPKNYGGDDAVGLLEYDFIFASTPLNEVERQFSKLSSYEFLKSFLDEQNLYPIIFADKWDAATESWLDGFSPDDRMAVKLFKDEYLKLSYDDETGLLRMSMTTLSPELSASLINKLAVAFNLYVKSKAVENVRARRTYLEERLETVKNLEVQRSIYRLLEAQLSVESLIFARDNYPLEILTPAIPPLFKSSPGRKKWTIFTFIGVVFGSIFLVIALVLFRKLKKAIEEYKQQTQPLEYSNADSEWVDS